MIGVLGCGPTALSMVYCGMTGDASMQPYEIARYAEENGYYVAGAGTSWDFMTTGAENLGLTVRALGNNKETIFNELACNKPVIGIIRPGDFTVSGKEKVELEEPDDIQNTLGEYLSELCFVMEADDFHVEMPEIQWKSAFIQINTDYMGRIMNNLISNMKKYADKNQKIYMELFEEKDWVGMRVQNGIIQPNPCVKGSGIGLKNIEIMMKKMNGYMSVDMTQSFFTIVLYFQRCASEEK